MADSSRGSFGSRMGIVLATAGSAVGLGNIWRFPYMTGQNGGAAFILLYLACVFILGLPGMMGEFVVGRHAKTNAARAYRMLGGRSLWGFTGYLGVITSMIILGFYAVVAGWCIYYVYASIVGHLTGGKEAVEQYFQTFSSHPVLPVACTLLFLLATHFVVVKGVRNGIEKASKILMPMLFVLLVIIVVAACLLPGAGKGISFLLKPDFSKLSPGTFIEALGQAFFSLSLGTACLCTYASYFNSDTHMPRAAVHIALLDTLIAILAGLMIFPAAFSVGVDPDSGPSLLFITLPNVFEQAFAPLGIPALATVISVIFYFLLSVAALTSTISMHEIGTAFIHEEMHLSRAKGAWGVTIVCAVIGVMCSLSMGAVKGMKIGGTDLLSFCDHLTAQYLLPLGALLTCLFVGWVLPKKMVYNELTNNGTLKGRFFHTFLFFVRWMCPVCILAIFVHQMGWI